MNNDIIVPAGTFELLYYDLQTFPLVVPITAAKGSGIPQQSIESVFNIGSLFYEDFLMNPFNTQSIQDMMLLQRQKELDRRRNGYIHPHSEHTTLPSFRWFIFPRFNGFLFCINITGLSAKNIPYDYYTFFDPHNIMIHQEEYITNRFFQEHITPVIEKYAFAYHYKSVTVRASHNSKKNDTRNDLSFYHPDAVHAEAKPPLVIQSWYNNTVKGSLKSFPKPLPHYYTVNDIFSQPSRDHSRYRCPNSYDTCISIKAYEKH